MNEEGWIEYEMQRLFKMPIPADPERDEFLKRLMTCKDKEEAQAFVQTVEDMYSPEVKQEVSGRGR